MNDIHTEIYTIRKVLDHGFIRLVAHLGNDSTIVNAARVSYGEGTKKVREDRGLIRYLLRNAHTSPFEQVVFTFHVKLPLFVARQWQRHRTARMNEISARYSVMPSEFYLPEGQHITKQSANNKQGREDIPLLAQEQDEIRALLRTQYEQAYAVYEQLIEKGIAREIARICLPVALFTEMYWQIDLHNLFHFLHLRLHAHAQYEIRVYAQEIMNIIQTICPLACEAFSDYILHTTKFYANEYPALKQLFHPHYHETVNQDIPSSTIDENIASIVEHASSLSGREKTEFLKKISAITNNEKKDTDTL